MLHILEGEVIQCQSDRQVLTPWNSEIPSNLLLKKISPKIWLPFQTAAWGIITMCLGFVKNYPSYMVVRAFLGLAEGGLLPGIVSLPYFTLKQN
jgi:MFS family permease